MVIGWNYGVDKVMVKSSILSALQLLNSGVFKREGRGWKGCGALSLCNSPKKTSKAHRRKQKKSFELSIPGGIYDIEKHLLK